ncbi:chitinase [Streptacidiphilus jiangxiensis]|uniref:Chitinase n=1 Tax=Streptacidiphilus jiangxiensis TaxID=235985 RepID=A0A1H7QLL4_STRJI|nr:chitinase [Streptacidiphilus jiangxiensis]
MRPTAPLRATAATSLALLAALALTSGPASAAGTAGTATGSATAATVPSHVFAPYVETYNGDDPATVAAQSGVKWVSLAFLQTAKAGSCTLDWNGSTSQPISSSVYGSSFTKLRAAGGDGIPSLGGYTADTTNTELADSCTSVSSITGQLEKLISTYGLSRVDFDVEQNSLTNSAGIDRRNKAITQVESWAASTGRHVQFSYTLPTNTDGLDSGGTAVLKNAVANHTRVDVVNIMTFDYYTGSSHEMATATETAAQGLVNQLGMLYPTKTSAQRWAMVGVTEMPGIDDYGKPETLTTADARTVYSWALGKGIDEISMWASERDNGGCPGTAGSDSCSGISQSTWYFSHTWEPYTN